MVRRLQRNDDDDDDDDDDDGRQVFDRDPVALIKSVKQPQVARGDDAGGE